MAAREDVRLVHRTLVSPDLTGCSTPGPLPRLAQPKARVKVARQHAKVCDARRDVLHTTSTDLVRRFEPIAVQDLAVANMVKNRCLSTAISRSGASSSPC
jgi:Probable transposase